MVIRVFKDNQAIGRAAAVLFAREAITNPKSVFGLATGSSPLTAYENMIKLQKEGTVDFSEVTTFNLDEYVGLSSDHPASYFTFMKENLFGKLGLKSSQTFVPSGAAENLEKECLEYEKAIEDAGGIDLQILGIGHNGHIAFNEPAEDFPYSTHIVDLTESTINANKRFFNSAADVPCTAITTGIGTIFKARKIILVAMGEDKAEAVKTMAKGLVTPQCPASILQLHSNVTILVDEGATSLL